MPNYILVHAKFFDADADDRKIIYKALKDRGWSKIHGHGISTSWSRSSINTAFSLGRLAKKDFTECSQIQDILVNIYYHAGERQIGSKINNPE